MSPTALHVCRGNGPGGMWHSAGGYGAISAQLFPKLDFGRLLLEYDSDRAGRLRAAGGRPRRHRGRARPAHDEVGQLDDEDA